MLSDLEDLAAAASPWYPRPWEKSGYFVEVMPKISQRPKSADEITSSAAEATVGTTEAQQKTDQECRELAKVSS